MNERFTQKILRRITPYKQGNESVNELWVPFEYRFRQLQGTLWQVVEVDTRQGG